MDTKFQNCYTKWPNTESENLIFSQIDPLFEY